MKNKIKLLVLGGLIVTNVTLLASADPASQPLTLDISITNSNHQAIVFNNITPEIKGEQELPIINFPAPGLYINGVDTFTVNGEIATHPSDNHQVFTFTLPNSCPGITYTLDIFDNQGKVDATIAPNNTACVTQPVVNNNYSQQGDQASLTFDYK